MAASLLLAGCGDLARLISPAGTESAEPARVAFTTSVVASRNRVATDVVALRVTSSYVLVGGARTQIGVQTLSLTSAASQAVPIPVDLASCLADANRESASAGGCPVMLELALTVNNEVVDRQTIGPLRLAPGATSQVTQPISLFEITSVELSASDIAINVASTATLSAIVRDSRGGAVAGRQVSWSSNNPTVASVDANGRVSAVGPGEARITASLESATSSARVQVSRAPLALRINSLAGSGTGVVRSTPAGIDCRVSNGTTSGVCVFDFAADAQVTLTSTADAGQQFGNWGDACVGNAIGTACTLTMAQARTASARFVALRRVQVNAASSDGHGRVFGDFGIDCRIDADVATGSCSAMVPEGTPVSLTGVAEAASGGQPAQRFTGWGGACGNQNGPTCTITPAGSDQVVSAVFAGPKTLSVGIDGAGGGSVSGGTIACSRVNGVNAGTCSQVDMHGANVVLTAQAANGATFAGWSGDCSGTTTTCTVAMTATRNVRATFTTAEVTLSVDMNGLGDGTVSLNGTEMCIRRLNQTEAITCTRAFPVGTVVTLDAAAGTKATYEGWSGACSGTSSTCTLTLTQSRSVGVTFATIPPVTLTVQGGGTGAGVVRSSETVPLINCTILNSSATGACSATVPNGTQITLRAVGNSGSALSGWGGSCSGQVTYECTLALDASLGVNGIFVPAIDVEMRVSGAGFGTVTFEPSGAPRQIPCATTSPNGTATCRFSLPTGSTGVFRGVPGAGRTFEGFLGSCAELVGSTPVPVCTYRGIGFLRVFTAVFK